MNDKPASESSEVVTSKGIGSSALLGSVSFSAAYQAGYETAKRGSFYRPNPHPANKESATAWDRGYEAYQFEQRRAEAQIKHAEGWANCRE